MIKKIKGVSLIWTVIIITIVMIVVSATVTTTSQEAQIATGSEQSSLAYSLARTGIEIAYTEGCVATGGNIINGKINGGEYILSVSTPDPINNPNHCFAESVGKVGSVSRKIKAEIKPKSSGGVVLDFPDDINQYEWSNITPSNSRAITLNSPKLKAGSLGYSFSQQFDLYRNSGVDNFSAVGTANYTGGTINHAFRVRLTNAHFYISTIINGNYSELSPYNYNDPTINLSSSTSFRVLIEYSQVSDNFNVKILDTTGGGSGHCIGGAIFNYGSDYTFNRISVGELKNPNCSGGIRNGNSWIYDNACGKPEEQLLTRADNQKGGIMAINIRNNLNNTDKNSYLKNMKFSNFIAPPPGAGGGTISDDFPDPPYYNLNVKIDNDVNFQEAHDENFSIDPIATPPGYQGWGDLTTVNITASISSISNYLITWGGDCSGFGPKIKVLMDSNKNCTLKFTQIWHPGKPGSILEGKDVYYVSSGFASASSYGSVENKCEKIDPGYSYLPSLEEYKSMLRGETITGFALPEGYYQTLEESPTWEHYWVAIKIGSLVSETEDNDDSGHTFWCLRNHH